MTTGKQAADFATNLGYLVQHKRGSAGLDQTMLALVSAQEIWAEQCRKTEEMGRIPKVLVRG